MTEIFYAIAGGLILIVTIVFFLLAALIWIYDIRLDKFQQNLKPGQKVHFYINDNRTPGVIMDRVNDDVVLINYLNHTYARPITEIYY